MIINTSKALILGIVQGLTEFLPISSSGHLVVLQNYLGFKEPLLLFDLILHGATLAAVIVYFRKELWKMILSILTWKKRGEYEIQGRKIFYLIIIGTIPTGLIGLIFKKNIEPLFANVTFTSLMFLFTGSFLWIGERRAKSNKGIKEVKIIDALLIGIMQGIAILPGVSRSGMTISTGLLRKMNKEFAFEFSFLLSIPAIAGALILEIKESMVEKTIPENFLPWIGGALISFIVGYISLTFLKKFVLKKKLFLFSYYCWILGGMLLISRYL